MKEAGISYTRRNLVKDGFEYAITGAESEGILPMQWRTGHIMYGYKNTPTPTGWFYASGIELETFVKGYK